MPIRTFTVAEANALIPVMEEVIADIHRQMGRVHRAAERLHVLDLLWGDRVTARDNPDYHEARECRDRITRLMGDIEEIVTREIEGRGLRFPQGGLDHGLIDFPTTWEGREVYLCWRRGESRIEAWHEVDGGFAGRQPLTPEQTRTMG